jgi:6-phosphogluconolactonase (cycloisomerase 2 family)
VHETARVVPARRRLPLALLAACALLPAASASADTVYVTDSAANVVHQFHVGTDGALTALNPPTVATSGLNPVGIAVSPNGRSVYTANQASAQTDGSVSQYDVFETGALVAKNPFAAFAAVSPDGVGDSVAATDAYAYVAGVDLVPGLFQFGADAAGLLSPLSPPFIGTGGEDVAVHPTLPVAYAAGANAIRRWEVQSDGTLARSASTAVTGVHRLAITPSGRYLYATAGLQDVFMFAIAPGDGRLSALGAVALPAGTVEHLVAGDSSVYVTTDSGVAMYGIGGGGTLAPTTPAAIRVTGDPNGIALSPDGRSAYVASYVTPGVGGSVVAQFDVGAGGVLAPKAAGPLSVGGTPEQIAVTTAGAGGSAPPPGPPPPPPPAPPAPRAEPPARRIPINEILLYRRAGRRFVGFKWDARGVRTEITCVLTNESPGLCDATVEIIDLFADNVRVVHFSATRRGRRRARRPVVLARGRIRLAPGRSGTIRLRFTRAGRRAVRGRRSLNAWVLTRLMLGSDAPLVAQTRAKLTPARARRAPRRRRGRR